MGTENALIDSGLGFEETAPQNFCHVLFAHGTGVFFHLAAKDIGYVLIQFVSQCVTLFGIGGE